MQQALPKFEFQDVADGYFLIVCRGELCWEDRATLVPEVERQLQERPTPAGIILDLGAVNFVSSAGVGALFLLIQTARARGLAVAFAQVPTRIVRIFEAVGLDRLALLRANRAWCVCGAGRYAAGNRKGCRCAHTPGAWAELGVHESIAAATLGGTAAVTNFGLFMFAWCYQCGRPWE
ncbi:MAG: STAS domain-containing protein [Phycisphaerales bacterium]|nr:STAS domain-containing protein [Phycisphaerales bacterium]